MTYCNLINLTNAILGVTTNTTHKTIYCQNMSIKQLCKNIDITFDNITSKNINVTDVLHNSLDSILGCNSNLTEIIESIEPIEYKFIKSYYKILLPIIIFIGLMIVYIITKYTMIKNKKTFYSNKKETAYDYFINFDKKHKFV
jgi:hypothetical protein